MNSAVGNHLRRSERGSTPNIVRRTSQLHTHLVSKLLTRPSVTFFSPARVSRRRPTLLEAVRTRASACLASKVMSRTKTLVRATRAARDSRLNSVSCCAKERRGTPISSASKSTKGGTTHETACLGHGVHRFLMFHCPFRRPRDLDQPLLARGPCRLDVLALQLGEGCAHDSKPLPQLVLDEGLPRSTVITHDDERGPADPSCRSGVGGRVVEGGCEEREDVLGGGDEVRGDGRVVQSRTGSAGWCVMVI